MANKVVMIFSQYGQLLGELENETIDGDLTILNPVQIHRTQNQIMYVPLLELAMQDTLLIKRKDYFGEYFEPRNQVADQYRQMFSRIQVQPSSIATLS